MAQEEGRLFAACKEYRRALKVLPSHYHARRMLPRALQAAGQLKEAEEAWREFLALFPDDAGGYIGY